MTTTPKISVIVPIYNVGPYLRQCVDSILAQTYDNLEVILVNDGSTDDCGEICREYAEKDVSLRVIHKENGGLSDARNAGLETASGEYLTFVDSDDWLSHDAVEALYKNLTGCDADISCCGYYMAYADSIASAADPDGRILVFDSGQAMEQVLLRKRVFSMAWGKLYKKYIFNAIRYPSGKIHEDEFVIFDVISQARRIVSTSDPKYYYRQRKGSIINETYSPRKINAIEACERKLLVIMEKQYAHLYDICKAELLSTNLHVFHQMTAASCRGSKNIKKTPEFNAVLSELRKNYKFIMRSPFFTKNEKIKAAAVKISVRLYRLIQSASDWHKKNTTKKKKEKKLWEL